MQRTFDTFEAAKEAAGDNDTICGTLLKDGVTARYFVQPVDAPNEAVRAASFEIREGRPMSEYELQLLRFAEAKRG